MARLESENPAFQTSAPSLKMAFARTARTVTQMTLAEPDVYLTATRA